MQQGSLPEYLMRTIRENYGEALADELISAWPARRAVSLRVNRLAAEAGEIAAELEQHGIRAEHVPWYPDALLLPEATEADLELLPVYREGKIYLQSLSAMIPPLLMDLREGQSILDMCAAPGGKTCEIAALTCGRADITACERDAVRAERLRYNLRTQHVRRAVVLQQDARRLDPAFRFDRILLDAPCTGSGTLILSGDNPPRRMEAEWVRKLTQTQRALLKKAAALLRSGGRLVYSTCSIQPEENEEVVRSAFETNDLKLVPVAPDMLSGVPMLPSGLPGTFCVRPTEQYEGFFVAVMEKA